MLKRSSNWRRVPWTRSARVSSHQRRSAPALGLKRSTTMPRCQYLLSASLRNTGAVLPRGPQSLRTPFEFWPSRFGSAAISSPFIAACRAVARRMWVNGSIW